MYLHSREWANASKTSNNNHCKNNFTVLGGASPLSGLTEEPGDNTCAPRLPKTLSQVASMAGRHGNKPLALQFGPAQKRSTSQTCSRVLCWLSSFPWLLPGVGLFPPLRQLLWQWCGQPRSATLPRHNPQSSHLHPPCHKRSTPLPKHHLGALSVMSPLWW